MNQKALSSSPTNVGVRQTPIMSIKGTPILSREKTRGIPTIYGCRTSRTCGYWGTCCTCILSPTPIRTPYWAGACPTVSAPRIRQRPCAWRSGSPEAATFAVHTPLGQGVTIRQRRLRQLPHGASHTDKHDRRI